MARTLFAYSPSADFRHAERLALWCLRHILRHDPPRCTTPAPQHACTFATDLDRVHARFQHAAETLGKTSSLPIRVDTRNSLSLSEDESMLLQCLARLQLGRTADDCSLAAVLPDRRWRAALTDALDELAAALAFGGYWLADPECLPAITWATHPKLAYAPAAGRHHAG